MRSQRDDSGAIPPEARLPRNPGFEPADAVGSGDIQDQDDESERTTVAVLITNISVRVDGQAADQHHGQEIASVGTKTPPDDPRPDRGREQPDQDIVVHRLVRGVVAAGVAQQVEDRVVGPEQGQSEAQRRSPHRARPSHAGTRARLIPTASKPTANHAPVIGMHEDD